MGLYPESVKTKVSADRQRAFANCRILAMASSFFAASFIGIGKSYPSVWRACASYTHIPLRTRSSCLWSPVMSRLTRGSIWLKSALTNFLPGAATSIWRMSTPSTASRVKFCMLRPESPAQRPVGTAP